MIGRDESTDLAVLKVDGAGYPFVNFEDSAKPRVGDWVLAIGNPLGLGGSATAGIVSTIARQLPDNSTQFFDYIQIDAPINRGNSGGPTFDIYGRVIGGEHRDLFPQRRLHRHRLRYPRRRGGLDHQAADERRGRSTVVISA